MSELVASIHSGAVPDAPNKFTDQPMDLEKVFPPHVRKHL
jgi:hypothetical protein